MLRSQGIKTRPPYVGVWAVMPQESGSQQTATHRLFPALCLL